MNVLDLKMWVYRHIAAWVCGYEAGRDGEPFDSNPYLKRLVIATCNKCNMYREPVPYWYEYYYCRLLSINIDDLETKPAKCLEGMTDLSYIWSMGYGRGQTHKGSDIKDITCPCTYWQSLGASKDAKSLGWRRVIEPSCKFCNGKGILPVLSTLKGV